MSEIILDIETTGISFNEGHKIVEIACIEINNFTPTDKIFHKLINPMREVPQEAFNIHGFSSEFLKTKKVFKEVADDFVEFIDNKKTIAHNASFDVDFLNYELSKLGKTQIKKDNVIDTLQIARGKFPGTSNSLDALCKRFNIDLSRRTKHNALLDCELLREVYINLLEQKEPKLTFGSDDLLKSNNDSQNTHQVYSKKIVEASKQELEKHKIFLKNELKKNFY